MAVMIAPRPFLNVKEVMVLLGCKENKAYEVMRKINKETEKAGFMPFNHGKVNKHIFAEKMLIPEEEIEKAIEYVAQLERG